MKVGPWISQRYLNFAGRLGRLRYIRYWLLLLVPLVAGIAIAALGGEIHAEILRTVGIAIAVVGFIFLFLGNLSLMTRRMHDFDFSGNWVVGYLCLAGIGGMMPSFGGAVSPFIALL